HSSDERMAAVGHSSDERMTVLQVDAARDRFLCAEHRQWVSVAKGDLDGVGPGDIVRVDWTGGRLARLQLLRTAADEMSSPEYLSGPRRAPRGPRGPGRTPRRATGRRRSGSRPGGPARRPV